MPVLQSQGFEAFYLARSRWLIGALRPIVGNDAEDVAQDAFAMLYQRWDVVSQYDYPEAWLKKIAVRVALRQRQRNALRPRNELLGAVLGHPSNAEEPVSALICDALKPLSTSEREALLLRYISDRPIQELAERFNCTEAAMRVRLHRACRRAQEQLMGLSGTWVMNSTWNRSALARQLTEHGHESAVVSVLDELSEIGDIRTHLQLADGRFLLTNGSDEHLDHGRYSLSGGRLRLDSAGYPGGVLYSVSLEGDSLSMRQIENHNPIVHGAPDDAFQFALVGSSAFTWHPIAS